MLSNDSPRWNSLVQQLLLRVAPAAVAATVFISVAPLNLPAQTGWKWNRPHAQAATTPEPVARNGFAAAVTRLMEQARREAQQGDFEAAIHSAERAAKLAEAAKDVLGPHPDCTPEAAHKLVNDLRVLQSAGTIARKPLTPPLTPAVAVAPKSTRTLPSTLPAANVPQATAARFEPRTPAAGLASPSLNVSQQTQSPTRPVPAQPAFVPSALTPPPVATVVTRPAVSSSSDFVAGGAIPVRPRYETSKPVTITASRPPAISVGPDGNYLALGGFSIIGGDDRATQADTLIEVPSQLDGVQSFNALADASPVSSPDITVVSSASSPDVSHFLGESLVLVDEDPTLPVQDSAARDVEYQPVTHEPLALSFMMEDGADVATSDVRPEVTQVVSLIATSVDRSISSIESHSPQPVPTEILPLQESVSLIVSSIPETAVEPGDDSEGGLFQAVFPQEAKGINATAAPQEIVIDASLIQWSASSTNPSAGTTKTQRPMDSAWDSTDSADQQPAPLPEQEPQAPVITEPAVSVDSESQGVVAAKHESSVADSSVLPVTLSRFHEVSQRAETSQVVMPAPDTMLTSKTYEESLATTTPTGPVTWTRTTELQPESISSKTESAARQHGLVGQLVQVTRLSRQGLGVVLGGCGLLLLSGGLFVFGKARNSQRT